MCQGKNFTTRWSLGLSGCAGDCEGCQPRGFFDYGLDLVFFDITSIYLDGDGPEGCDS